MIRKDLFVYLQGLLIIFVFLILKAMSVFSSITSLYHRFKKTDRIFQKIVQRSFIYDLLPDKTAIKLFYLNVFPDQKGFLENPRTFNAKLQWLKLYDRDPQHRMMVDKVEVKPIIAEMIGEDYIIPTLGVYDRFDDIDFDALPSAFVLKPSHGGGGKGVVICRDKSKFDLDSARKIIGSAMRADTYKVGREWPYKGLKRRILVENLLVEQNSAGGGYPSDIKDYKIFCFNGKPAFFSVHEGRFSCHKSYFYDFEGKRIDIGKEGSPGDSSHKEEKIRNLDEMRAIAAKISTGIPFVRVDLYNIDGKIFFGEATFFPASGIGRFVRLEQDYRVGDMLELPRR